MTEIIDFIAGHWVEWFFSFVLAALAFGYRIILHRLKVEQKKSDAIGKGVQALLRESIVTNYNKYTNRGYCPIYAKDSIKKVYAAYHGLGGDDVATIATMAGNAYCTNS